MFRNSVVVGWDLVFGRQGSGLCTKGEDGTEHTANASYLVRKSFILSTRCARECSVFRIKVVIVINMCVLLCGAV